MRGGVGLFGLAIVKRCTAGNFEGEGWVGV